MNSAMNLAVKPLFAAPPTPSWSDENGVVYKGTPNGTPAAVASAGDRLVPASKILPESEEIVPGLIEAT